MALRIKEMALIEDILSPKSSVATRDGYGKGLVEAGEENPDVWVITADVTESARVNWFAEKFPKRFIQVGIAEQNMAGVAAGIAACGKTAVMSSFAAFSPGRNWDQIRVSICYTDVNVKICSSHAGLTVGPDGATHQALEDIGMLRPLPNITIIVPSDAEQARRATKALIAKHGPVYMRTSREKTAVFTTDKTPFEIGKANIYRDGKDVTIVACGFEVYESLKASELLAKEGIECTLVDCHTIKPIDRETIIDCARKTRIVITVEEHQINGGLGSAVSEVLAESNSGAILTRHGIMDTFCESGDAKDLLKKYKLDAAGIVEVVKEAMKNKK